MNVQKMWRNKIILKKLNNNMKIIIPFIIINLIFQISSYSKLHFFKFKLSNGFYNITLKIKGMGKKYVFSSNNNFPTISRPNSVYINGIRQNITTTNYIFNQTDNIVFLALNSYMKSTYYMFSGCSDITEFDFSNFNTSKITSMASMFEGCSSLISLNLSNFNTSLVSDMRRMFTGCKLLTSLDLSSFNTSKVYYITEMFSDCINLEYINLINFNERLLDASDGWYKNMFKNVPDNIVVCMNEENIKDKILPQIRNKTCAINNCTNN